MKIRDLIPLLAALMMTGCASLTDRTSSVSVSGLNYSDTGFSYIVKDPKDPDRGAGGESISPYGGGGIMCCYGLPLEWRPGIQVLVKIYQYDYEQRREKLVKEVLAEVPPYPEGRPGTLWAVLYPDGGVEAISSNVDPNHPAWPGKIKSWPEPSVEYRRYLWAREVARVESSLDMYERLSLEEATAEGRKESWEHDLRYSAKSIQKFSGPDDPAYYDWLKANTDKGRSFANRRLEELQRIKP